MRRAFAIIAAVLLHAVILLFGGVVYGGRDEEVMSLTQVELLSPEQASEEPKPDAEKERAADAAQSDPEEAPPDSAEVLRELDAAPTSLAPALEAASLSAIESALFGGGGDTSFGGSLSFASGGVIGGTGKPGAILEQSSSQAFDLSEIDQRPREILKTAPNYPAEMRGKKIEGVATLIFIVSDQGRVTEPRVVNSTHAAFEKPALQAVKQWKFEPAIRGGKRVSCRMRVQIRFSPSK